jgi:hypothetical protein
MMPSLSAGENRSLANKIIEQIRAIKNEIIETLAKKHECMLKIGLFSNQSNSQRIVSMFRTLLTRRLDNDTVVDIALTRLKLTGRGKKIVRKTSNLDSLTLVQLILN